MPVLPNTLDANVNNPNMFSSFSGGKRKTSGKRKRTMKKRTIKKRKSRCKR